MKYLNTRGHGSWKRILALSAFAFAFPIGANAQWTVINLHPAGATRSWAIGVGGGQQVGIAGVGGQSHASLWYGIAASWVDLNPAGAVTSLAQGVSGGQQAGYAWFADPATNPPHAGTWNGTAASWVDLNPAGASGSY